MTSCYLPTTQLPSTVDSSNNNNNNNNNDDDDDDDDRPSRRLCGDRDSCQDSCDELFKSSSSRSSCYDLEFRDINVLTSVGDELNVRCEEFDTRSCEMYIGSVDEDDLEDIDSSDFDLYLSVGIEDFIEALENEEGFAATEDDLEKRNAEEKAFTLLEWIGENSDIAETVLEHDDDLELGRSIFQLAGSLRRRNAHITNDNNKIKTPHFTDEVNSSNMFRVALAIDEISGSNYSYFEFDSSEIQHHENARVSSNNFSVTNPQDTTVLVNRINIEVESVAFIFGFLDDPQNQLNGETFLSFSDRNENAFNWGHNTLVDFCEDLTDQG